MVIRAPNLNHLWTTLLIEELVRNGVDTYCVAPGSRNAPLSVAVARHHRTRCIVHHDERGAAFHALGHARASGVPAAVVTTSGSALANVWPAVAEASLAQIPLLVLTADRPPELQDAGANQTMDQVRFFGGFAQWSTTLPCPSTSIDPAVVLTTADQAASRCRGPTRGAVHVNCMFREPLAPTDLGECYEAYLEPVRAWCESDRVYTRYEDPSVLPAHESLAEVVELVRRSPRGLLVAGRLPGAEAREAVVELAEVLRWPLLADVTSGLRLDARPRTIVPYHDVLLSSEAFMQRRMRTCPKPVIAMVAGYAVGGGHVLHVMCDLTIAADNAVFGQTGPRVGSFDGGYGASYLARIVGQKKAREIWYLCRQYDAVQALEMGLVNAVVPYERLEEETVRWCREILANSPIAIRCLKAAFNADCDGQAGLQELAGNATMLFYMTEEGQEGRNAFVEKRRPDFSKFPRRP